MCEYCDDNWEDDRPTTREAMSVCPFCKSLDDNPHKEGCVLMRDGEPDDPWVNPQTDAYEPPF